MTYFCDLSAFEYDPGPLGSPYLPLPEGLRILNVGWLAPFHRFRKGPTPEEFRRKLQRLCQSPDWRHRGFHICSIGFCRAFPGRSEKGWGVIVVPGKAGTYAAPTLICHYLERHRYLPPEEFIEAVEAYGGGSRPGVGP